MNYQSTGARNGQAKLVVEVIILVQEVCIKIKINWQLNTHHIYNLENLYVTW